MKTAIAKNLLTGEKLRVKATTENAASSYGRAVWETEDRQALGEVGSPILGYEIIELHYMHKETGSTDTREGWEASYDPEELEARGLTASEAFDEDEGETLIEDEE
jgi:hypothetical protein